MDDCSVAHGVESPAKMARRPEGHHRKKPEMVEKGGKGAAIETTRPPTTQNDTKQR